jgi:hypothetical protein
LETLVDGLTKQRQAAGGGEDEENELFWPLLHAYDVFLEETTRSLFTDTLFCKKNSPPHKVSPPKPFEVSSFNHAEFCSLLVHVYFLTARKIKISMFFSKGQFINNVSLWGPSCWMFRGLP